MTEDLARLEKKVDRILALLASREPRPKEVQDLLAAYAKDFTGKRKRGNVNSEVL